MNTSNKSHFTILIVDDNPLELGLIRLVVQKNFPDLKCLTLTKPPNWEMFFQSQIVDAIIVDYRLPEKNGLEHIKEIRKFNSEVPAFLITALEKDEIDQDIIKAGATDLIVKDRSYSNLVSKLNDIILRETFKKFEQELSVLKFTIASFSSLLILKIDFNGDCLELIGNEKKFNFVTTETILGKEWKKIFGDLFDQLIAELKGDNFETAKKEFYELDFDNNTIKLRPALIKAGFYYLILQLPQ